MASAKSQRLILALVSIALSAVFAGLAVFRLDMHQVADALRHAHPLPWVPFAIACYLAGQLVRGQRCRLLVQREATLGLTTASNIVVIGYASNNVLPARLGELVRAGLLVERTGIPFSQALTVTFTERLCDGIAILLLLVAGTFTQPTEGWISHLARVGGVVFGCASLVVIVAVLTPGTLLSLASSLGGRFGSKLQDRAIRLAMSVTNGTACFRRPVDALRIAILSIFVWLLEAGMFVFVLPAFDLRPNVATGIIAMSVTNLGILVPSAPGFIGSFHYFCSRALLAQAVAEPTALSYAIVVHLAFYVPVTLWGLGIFLRYGTELGATFAMIRSAPAVPAGESGPRSELVLGEVDRRDRFAQTTRFFTALAEALLPQGTGAKDGTIVTDVACFVSEQMQALPVRLRLMFDLGMIGFRAFTRLRRLRGFCDLPLEQRRELVDGWAFGRIALLRQLFRPLRSTVLLAYYEHAGVRAGQEGRSAPILAAEVALEAHG